MCSLQHLNTWPKFCIFEAKKRLFQRGNTLLVTTNHLMIIYWTILIDIIPINLEFCWFSAERGQNKFCPFFWKARVTLRKTCESRNIVGFRGKKVMEVLLQWFLYNIDVFSPKKSTIFFSRETRSIISFKRSWLAKFPSKNFIWVFERGLSPQKILHSCSARSR